MANIYDMTDTWNNGATTFTAIKMDVSDAASASGSKLMDLQVDGSSKVVINKSGSVGIGTSSPNGKLDITGSGNTDIYLNTGNNSGDNNRLFFGDTADIDVGYLSYDHGTNTMSFGVNASERMQITSTGNVGIGTSAPSSDAIVRFVNVSDATSAGLVMTAARKYSIFSSSSSTLSFRDETAGAERMMIDSLGRVGVGTSSPANKIDVVGDALAPSLTTNTGLLRLQTFTSNEVQIGAYPTSPFAAWIQTKQNNNSGASFPLALNPLGGSVGIGTNSPSEPLHINGASPSILLENNAESSVYKAYIDVNYSPTNTFAIRAGQTSPTFLSWDNTAAGALKLNGVAGNGGAYPIVFQTAGTERARIDSSGNLLVGTTSDPFGVNVDKFSAVTSGTGKSSGGFKNDDPTFATLNLWNASTSSNSTFVYFATETSNTARGTINYNRSAGLVAYNTTSDYRAKDIIGAVTDSGAVIDSTPVYMGKMKGATQERPMFIAHEVPAYAQTGEKDAVDADGNPIYQQMDVSALVPLMWAEIQSLRARVAQLEGAN